MRTNLVKNPSFEVNVAGWSADQGTLVRTTSNPSVATWAGKIGTAMAQVTVTPGTSTTWFGMVQAIGDATPVVEGQWVAARVWGAHDNANSNKMRLQAVLRGGVTAYRQSPLVSAGFYMGAFHEVVFQVPAGTTSVVLQAQVVANTGSPVDGSRLWSDQVRLHVGATEAEVRAALAPAYFDGDTPDTADWTYSWTGTPHASTSTMVPTPGLRVERLPDAGAPQAGITVTGLAPSSESVISVQVSWDDGRTWHGVRGAERVSVTGGDFFRDHVPPLNVLARYRLVVHAGGVTPLRLEDTITIASDSAWIQDPLNPRGAVAVSPARGRDTIRLLSTTAARITRQQPVDLATVEGASLPVASIGRRQAPSRVPVVLQDLAAAQGALVRALDDLLGSAGQLVVRGLPAGIPLDPVAHVVAPNLEDSPVVGGVVGHREWVLTVSQTRPTSMRIVIPWWTYDQVQALWAPRTYDQVEATRPGATYLDWSRDPEVP